MVDTPRHKTADGGEARIPHHREKMKLRLWTFRFWKQLTILDLFAGMGFLSEEYARARCDRLVCVRKPEYFKVLGERMRPYPKVVLHNVDNMGFLETIRGQTYPKSSPSRLSARASLDSMPSLNVSFKTRGSLGQPIFNWDANNNQVMLSPKTPETYSSTDMYLSLGTPLKAVSELTNVASSTRAVAA